MDKPTKNNNKQNFLKQGLHDDISKHHKQYLGTDIPDGYFVKSKQSILDKILSEEILKEVQPNKKFVFWMQPQFKYMVAASLVFIFSLTIWLQNANNTDNDNNIYIEELAFSDAVLINSLFLEDSEVDAFADATLFNEVLLQAELSEEKLDNLILNSLIIDDSLLNNYMGNEFIEIIIL